MDAGGKAVGIPSSYVQENTSPRAVDSCSRAGHVVGNALATDDITTERTTLVGSLIRKK